MTTSDRLDALEGRIALLENQYGAHRHEDTGQSTTGTPLPPFLETVSVVEVEEEDAE